MKLTDVPNTFADTFRAPGGTGWTAQVGNDDATSSHGFTVYAICAPLPATG